MASQALFAAMGLILAALAGNYVADVNGLVSDSKGRKVVEHVAEGPIFMARPPAGEYEVSATYGGKSVNRKTRIAANRLRAEYFRWPAKPGDDLPVSRWLDKE